jgi:hypothetical protein
MVAPVVFRLSSSGSPLAGIMFFCAVDDGVHGFLAIVCGEDFESMVLREVKFSCLTNEKTCAARWVQQKVIQLIMLDRKLLTCNCLLSTF